MLAVSKWEQKRVRTNERLLVHPRLLLVNLMYKVYFVIRRLLFPPFPNEGLDTLELTKLVAYLGKGCFR